MLKEFILALLVTKFVGVRKDGLAQLAGSLALQAEKEEEATALVEKITADKVTNFVKDWRSEVDKEVSTSTQTFEKTLKDKYDLVEKKDPAPADPPKPVDPNNPVDIAAIIAKAVSDAVAPIQQKLNGIEGEKVKTSRLEQMTEKLTGVPETFKTQKLNDFNRMNFESDEQFAEYLTETETNIVAFNQELADNGMSSHARPFVGSQNKDGVSTSVASFIASKTDEKPLSGKEL